MSDSSLILLGKRVREIRIKRSISQEKLSELSGISSRHISEMERGESNPSYQVLNKIARSLDIDLIELFDFGHQKEPDELRKNLSELIASLEDDKLRFAYRIIKKLSE